LTVTLFQSRYAAVFASCSRLKLGVAMKTHALRLSVATAVLAGSLAFAAPAQASIKIGVASSPNGFVMKDVPTQIAVSGVKSAGVFLWNEDQKKYFRIGQATPAKAVNYTFLRSGIQRVQIRPSKGKAKVFRVAVYDRFNGAGAGTPTAYGSLTLPSRADNFLDNFARSFSAAASRGCVLVDIGAKTDRGSIKVNVQSTGADQAAFDAAPGNPVGVTNVPVRGDAVVEFFGTEARGNAWGLIWTCLSDR
jgi:hypothetical protein